MGNGKRGVNYKIKIINLYSCEMIQLPLEIMILDTSMAISGRGSEKDGGNIAYMPIWFSLQKIQIFMSSN